jgi:dTDP-glucose pyrophosphorylase
VLAAASARIEGATVFACHVNDPQRYDVIEFDPGGKVLSIAEKSPVLKSDYAVAGLYFHDDGGSDIAAACVPRRARNHRYRPGLSAGRTIASRAGGTRHGLARCRHP